MTDTPLVSFELKEKYLLVIGHGKRDSFAEMAQASSLIYEKALETNSRYILIDYRKLQVNVRLTEAFNIVKRYEVTLPKLRDLTVAAVFEKKGKGREFGNYWKDIGRQRGFFIEVFENMNAAEAWLLEQIAKAEAAE